MANKTKQTKPRLLNCEKLTVWPKLSLLGYCTLGYKQISLKLCKKQATAFSNFKVFFFQDYYLY